MKAESIGIKLKAVFKGMKENPNSEEQGFSPMVVHDEHRI